MNEIKVHLSRQKNSLLTKFSIYAIIELQNKNGGYIWLTSHRYKTI